LLHGLGDCSCSIVTWSIRRSSCWELYWKAATTRIPSLPKESLLPMVLPREEGWELGSGLVSDIFSKGMCGMPLCRQPSAATTQTDHNDRVSSLLSGFGRHTSSALCKLFQGSSFPSFQTLLASATIPSYGKTLSHFPALRCSGATSAPWISLCTCLKCGSHQNSLASVFSPSSSACCPPSLSFSPPLYSLADSSDYGSCWPTKYVSLSLSPAVLGGGAGNNR